MIIYYVIFGSLRVDKVPVAVLAFGINSGAYVAEIFRSGIMSIDNGQFEAGRSWDSTILRRCGTLLCLRHLRIFCLRSAMNLFPAERDIGCRFIALQDLTKAGYYPEYHLQCNDAAACGGCHISDYCYYIYPVN